MNFDPAATLAHWQVDVDIGARTYTIPALPAADWLMAILGSTADIIPGLLPDDPTLDDALLDGTLPPETCQTAARAAISAAAGTTWWSAARLVHACASSWVGAELLLAGIDPTRVSLATYLMAAHRAATRTMSKEKLVEFEFNLDRPPAGVDPVEWFDEDAAADNFLAVMGVDGDYHQDAV